MIIIIHKEFDLEDFFGTVHHLLPSIIDTKPSCLRLALTEKVLYDGRSHKVGVAACQLNPWLGGDNRSEKLNTWGGLAGLSGLAETLALVP